MIIQEKRKIRLDEEKHLCTIMQLLVLLMIFRSIYGLIYEKRENREISADSIIHVENDVPSELTCLHICLRLNGYALYAKKKCQCVGKVDIVSNDSPLMTGTYIQTKQTPKDESLKACTLPCNIGPLQIKRSQQIADIRKVLKEYHIQVKFKIDQSKLLIKKWHNIFHITNGRNYPLDPYWSIFLQRDNFDRDYVYIYWPKNYRLLRTSRFASNFKIDFIQRQTNKGYETRILMNDVGVTEQMNPSEQEFKNLIAYASDPWYPLLENSTILVSFIKGVELKRQIDE